MHRKENPASSPIRKQLVKKIVSYYSQLDGERQQSRSRSPGRTKTHKNPNLSPKRNKPQYMIEKNLETYQDTMHRNAKLGRLEDLMNTELERAYHDNALVHKPVEMHKSVQGYPEFMKEKVDRLKFKELQRKDSDEVEQVDFKEPVHQILKKKVEKATEDPASDGESIEDEPLYDKITGDIYDEQLYHVNTQKNYIHPSSADADRYDFHQRKSKEIRRLQYSAGLRKKKVEYERFKVWVLYQKTPFPAELVRQLQPGDEKGQPLEVREGDNVHIEVLPVDLEEYKLFPHLQDYLSSPKTQSKKPRPGYILHGFPEVIKGNTNSPNEEDLDCDFIAKSPNGKKWPVLINYREIPAPPPYRDVDPTNCEIFGPDGESRGRAYFNLVGDDGLPLALTKAFLCDNDGYLTEVLVNRINKSKIQVKMLNKEKIIETIEIEEILNIDPSFPALHILTLREEYSQKLPRQIYYFPGQDNLQNINLLSDEQGLAICTDCKDYEGQVLYDGGEGFRLNFIKEQYEDFDGPFVRVVMDNDGLPENFVNVLSIQNEIQQKIDNRLGGPWVIDPNDESPFEHQHITGHAVIPKVSKPSIARGQNSAQKYSQHHDHHRTNNYSVGTPAQSNGTSKQGKKSHHKSATRSKKSSIHNSNISSKRSSKLYGDVHTTEFTSPLHKKSLNNSRHSKSKKSSVKSLRKGSNLKNSKTVTTTTVTTTNNKHKNARSSGYGQVTKTVVVEKTSVTSPTLHKSYSKEVKRGPHSKVMVSLIIFPLIFNL